MAQAAFESWLDYRPFLLIETTYLHGTLSCCEFFADHKNIQKEL
jgi:hypothetical protein